ncbi:MAG: hypothetical protein C0501_06695 [Isosphaera sp.]|nr:hypothetical protein [Isosphaera sp.]
MLARNPEPVNTYNAADPPPERPMSQFQGEKTFPLPVAEVAAGLSDAAFLAGCLPDAEVSEATPERAVWKQRPKLSFLTGSLTTELTRTAHDPGKSVSFGVVAKAIGASSTVGTALTFAPADGGTVVRWAAEITQVTGLLKMVPGGLIRGAAEKVIADVWEAVAAKLAAGS